MGNKIRKRQEIRGTKKKFVVRWSRGIREKQYDSQKQVSAFKREKRKQRSE